MADDLALKERRLLAIQIIPALTAGPMELTMDLNDRDSVMQTKAEIIEYANRPLVAQITTLAKENEALKQRVISLEWSGGPSARAYATCPVDAQKITLKQIEDGSQVSLQTLAIASCLASFP
jgi:hypothetical protein